MLIDTVFQRIIRFLLCFYIKKTKRWTCGSPSKPIQLTESEAIQKAEEILNKVLKIDPNYVQALNLMSKIYIKLNRFDDAIAILGRAKSFNPFNVERMLIMGEINLGLGKCDDAEENFRSVLKLDPVDERAVFGLGKTLASSGKIEEGRRVLSQVKKGAELAIYFNNKGVLLVKSGKYSEGVSLYKNAIKVLDMPDKEYLLLYNIALAYSKLGDKAKAIENSDRLKIARCSELLVELYSAKLNNGEHDQDYEKMIKEEQLNLKAAE